MPWLNGKDSRLACENNHKLGYGQDRMVSKDSRRGHGMAPGGRADPVIPSEARDLLRGHRDRVRRSLVAYAPRDDRAGPYALLLVFPRANACSTPRGPSPPSPLVGTFAIRRAVPLRWLDEAKWSSRTTVGIE